MAESKCDFENISHGQSGFSTALEHLEEPK